MNLRFFLLSMILLTVMNSCKENKTDRVDKDSTEISADPKILTDTTGINNTLQGIWRESEYPYRQIHFEKNQMKFIEEGVVEEPKFKEFRITRECPYNVNNIISTSPEDIFLVIVDDKSCEKLNIDNNTLKLSGYNISSQSDYTMAFKRVEK